MKAPKQTHLNRRSINGTMIAVASSTRSSMTQHGRALTQEASFTFRDGIHYEEEPLTISRCTFHMCGGPSPQCNLAHVWLLKMESKKINDFETGAYWGVEVIMVAFCFIPGKDMRHVIRKGGHMLHMLQAL